MSIQKRYPSVNWIDGMKITRQHLVDTENYIMNQLYDTFSAQINQFNYGLLPARGLGDYLNDFVVENKITKEVEISLKTCDAITLSGLRITINSEIVKDGLVYKASYSGTGGIVHDIDKVYYVAIVINPYDRQPIGDLDPVEIPPRHPYTMPKVGLTLMSSEGVNTDNTGGYFLIIGKVIRKADGFYKDAGFIPPCTSIRSHPLLVRYYETFGSIMNEIQLNAISIVQKIKNKQQKSELAYNIRMLVDVLLQYIAQTYFRFRNVAHQQPPVYSIEIFSALANIMYTSLNTMSEKDKEEMLKYFYEWCDVLPSNFESQLVTCVGIRYDHLNVGQMMSHIERMLQSISLIVSRLNTLEYIGQHKENLVVKEEVVNQTAKEKTGWSILD
ncbi:hypothetical protein QNI19_11885 [Cytophagaceae bacterium DM2B3-1]|uniref:Type VI secretion system baseplate subunit TssK n=1 Tax=Xanthocytophaga flava TaxID=3048013 RepID=A0ABT7CIT9_9BACT|nr:hypothetical protein [Xanthocytophaga flavus]MDJ1469687.1 hypothetical protein [Xanthocytophaga flavus]MDJ1493635.1 hypothetical protein [Xanthocytophaga flavus]